MTWPTASERLEQLERLDRWCLEAPPWKRHFAAALIAVALSIPRVVLNLWFLPPDRACVVECGALVCFDLRSTTRRASAANSARERSAPLTFKSVESVESHGELNYS